MSLTPKQDKFCNEYLIDLNATQAAIRAGYSEKTARQIGQENLSKPDIQERIKELMKEREKRTQITQDQVITEFAILGFSNIKDYMEHDASTQRFIAFKDINEIPDDKARAIEAIKVNYKEGKIEFKLHSKTKTLEMIGRHLGMFTDKFEHSGHIDSELIINVVKTK